MHKIPCIIVDDEPLPIQLLSEYVSKTPFLSLAATFSNPVEALSYLNDHECGLVLLDIQMPELSGIQFLKLMPAKTQVILTTAYDNYALQSYDLDVTDYLMKPIPFDRFLKATTKAWQRIAQPEVAPPAPAFDEVIFVKTDARILKIALADILFIEGKKEYIAIHTTTGQHLTLQNLKKMEELLPARRFLRVHKSFIVPIDKIDAIERNRIFIKNTVIPVGDTYREIFFRVIDRS